MVHWRLVVIVAAIVVVALSLSLGLYEWSRVAKCDEMSSAFEDIQDSYNQKLGDYRIREHDYVDYYTRLNRTGDLSTNLIKDLDEQRKSLGSEKVELDVEEQRLSDMRIALNKQCLA